MYRVIERAFDWQGSVLLLTPNRRSFGNGAEQIYYGLLRGKREGKKIVFLYPRPFIFRRLGLRVVNRELFNLDSVHVLSTQNFWGFIGGFLLSIYGLCLVAVQEIRLSSRLRQLFGRSWRAMEFDLGFNVSRIGRTALWKPHGVKDFSLEILDNQHWREQHEGYTPPRLKNGKRRWAEVIREQMGIPLNDWFVCVHVRAPEPLACRNASLDNYIPAIKTITAAGGWVVRLGDSSMPGLPRLERVVDYAHTAYKSEVMDIYLIEQCRFILGMNSGPTMVGHLLGKLSVLVNMTEWYFGMPPRKGDVGILKHVFSRSRNRFLGVKEVLNERVMVQVFGIPAEDYALIENSPQEIQEVVEEVLTRSEPCEYSHLQIAFNGCRRKQLRQLLTQGEPSFCYGVPEQDLVLERYRIGAGVEVAGTLGQRYLDRNWLNDQLNESSSRCGNDDDVTSAV